MLNKIIGIVKEASKIMLDDTHFHINEKGSASNLVTTNDVRVQAFLQKELEKLLPNSSFLCEEGDVRDTSKDYVWIIDPIDGTANYARHITVCAISVALEYKHEIIIGVVYNPYQNALFTAQKGEGAYLNGEKIHVSDTPFRSALLYTAFSMYEKEYSHSTFMFAEDILPYINDLRRTGSAACELCNVACGRGDMFFELKLYPWDYAAASLIIKEAGGYISCLDVNTLPLERPTTVVAANTKENQLELIKHASKFFK